MAKTLDKYVRNSFTMSTHDEGRGQMLGSTSICGFSGINSLGEESEDRVRDAHVHVKIWINRYPEFSQVRSNLPGVYPQATLRRLHVG